MPTKMTVQTSYETQYKIELKIELSGQPVGNVMFCEEGELRRVGGLFQVHHQRCIHHRQVRIEPLRQTFFHVSPH